MPFQMSGICEGFVTFITLHIFILIFVALALTFMQISICFVIKTFAANVAFESFCHFSMKNVFVQFQFVLVWHRFSTNVTLHSFSIMIIFAMFIKCFVRIKHSFAMCVMANMILRFVNFVIGSQISYQMLFSCVSFITFATLNILQIVPVIKLVRCPKWLFDKFNILEFKRGAEWGCQRLRNYFHNLKCVWRSFYRVHENAKRPKFAGPIYFHVHVYLEVILYSARKRNKKGPNLPAQFISTRKYIWRSF